jgi:IPT/TIG domain-containing protein
MLSRDVASLTVPGRWSAHELRLGLGDGERGGRVKRSALFLVAGPNASFARRTVVLTLSLVSMLFAPLPVQAVVDQTVVDPVNCTGYSTPRTFLDSQAWWVTEESQTGTNFGHVHLSTCFPLNQTVSGVVPFDIELVLHKNTGALFHIQPFLCRTTDNTSCTTMPDQVFSPAYTCDPITQVTCTFWYHYDWDTTVHPSDGPTSFRFRTEVIEPDGNVLRASNDWLAVIDNGKPLDEFTPAGLSAAKGWYTQGGYSNVMISAGYPPPGTTGDWTLSGRCGATIGISECLATVDPDFHAGSEGVVQYRAATGGEFTITIDRSAFAPGTHYLAFRTKAIICSGPDVCSTKAGILKIPFAVSGVLTASQMPPAAATITGFDPTDGAVGDPVTITGANFTGATGVTFSGTSATYIVTDDTSISTTVPAGATTGPIAVTTPGGTAASGLHFTVNELPPLAATIGPQ